MAKKIDEVEFLALWLHLAAQQAGQLEVVRGVIRSAMNESVEMYGLREFDEPDKPWDIPALIGRFAAAWDEADRQSRGQ
jgi:hypothetical protein